MLVPPLRYTVNAHRYIDKWCEKLDRNQILANRIQKDEYNRIILIISDTSMHSHLFQYHGTPLLIFKV